MKKLLARAATISAVVIATSMVPLAGTSFAATCSGAGCDNLGPRATGCETASVSTQRTIDNNGRKAELRWSAGCSAAWVRVTNNASNPLYESYGYIEKYDSAGKLIRSLEVKVPDTTGGSDWSNMLGGASYYYRVCIRFVGNVYPMECSTKF